jgi:hypothetical protein
LTGILLIVLAVAWLIAVLLITRRATWHFSSRAAKVAISLVLFPALLVAPLADELIGKWQFESLCKQYAVVEIDEQHASNRRVLSTLRKDDQFAEGTVVPIRIDPWIYRDAETGQVVVRYNTLHAEGGLLIHSLGISESNSPLVFRSGCGPENERAFIKKFNMQIIN